MRHLRPPQLRRGLSRGLTNHPTAPTGALVKEWLQGRWQAQMEKHNIKVAIAADMVTTELNADVKLKSRRELKAAQNKYIDRQMRPYLPKQDYYEPRPCSGKQKDGTK